MGERELSWEMVVEVCHRGVLREGGHLVRGDVWRAALLQRAQGAGERRRWRRRLAAHVQARRGAGAELGRRAPLERACVLVKVRGRVVLLFAVHGCHPGVGTQSGDLEPGTRSCAALPLPAPPLLFLTASLCSQREPAAGGDSLAGCPAIGSAVAHVARPGAIIGRSDCLKKRGPGPREQRRRFDFLSQLRLLHAPAVQLAALSKVGGA